MATIDKLDFTNSVIGRPVLISETASPGTNVHVASTNSSVYDEVWLYATNNGSNVAKLTVECGSNSAGDLLNVTIASQSGLYLIIPGQPYQGNTTPAMVRAYSNVANIVSLSGWVNRIS